MNHWSNYWRKTTSTNSFQEGAQGGQYTQAVQSFWEQQFAGLAAGAVLLDVGTGNGAIAIIASRYSVWHRLNFRVIATDQAFIDPAATFQNLPELRAFISAIEFLPETRMESLPFSPESIDLITSQFAFEYSSVEHTVPEFSRILKRGGRCVCVAHDVRTALVKNSMTGISVLCHLLESTEILSILRQLFNRIQPLLVHEDIGALRTDADANKMRSQLNAEMSRLAGLFSTPAERMWLDPFLRNVLMLFSGLSGANIRERITMIDVLVEDNLSALARIREQVNVALDEEKLLNIKTYAEKWGLELNVTDFYQDENLIGKTLIFTKTKV